MATSRIEKAKQLKTLETLLLLTGIAGALVIAGFAFVSFHTTTLVSADGTRRDSMFGMDVIVFAAAVSTVYAFINYKNLLALDKDGLTKKSTWNDFHAKTEKFLAGTQGVMLVSVFTFGFWALYSFLLSIRYYISFDNKQVDFTLYNYVWLALMFIELVLSIAASRQAGRVRRK
jgi:steroid 5-alpha reductase family enzyme